MNPLIRAWSNQILPASFYFWRFATQKKTKVLQQAHTFITLLCQTQIFSKFYNLSRKSLVLFSFRGPPEVIDHRSIVKSSTLPVQISRHAIRCIQRVEGQQIEDSRLELIHKELNQSLKKIDDKKDTRNLTPCEFWKTHLLKTKFSFYLTSKLLYYTKIMI